MIYQAKFNAAVQLGNSPKMKFNSDLNKYVQFVTMFSNNFDKTICDSSALYNLLERLVTGQAKEAIKPCIFSNPSRNSYEQAMKMLAKRYEGETGLFVLIKRI